LLKAKGLWGNAESLMRRALAISEASYSPEHPTLAIRLNNVASLLEADNRPADAEPLMRRALAIAEASYGPDFPEVGRNLNGRAAAPGHQPAGGGRAADRAGVGDSDPMDRNPRP